MAILKVIFPQHVTDHRHAIRPLLFITSDKFFVEYCHASLRSLTCVDYSRGEGSWDLRFLSSHFQRHYWEDSEGCWQSQLEAVLQPRQVGREVCSALLRSCLSERVGLLCKTPASRTWLFLLLLIVVLSVTTKIMMAICNIGGNIYSYTMYIHLFFLKLLWFLAHKRDLVNEIYFSP